jgi:hypothetical protein
MTEDTFLVFGNRLTLELESFAQFTDDKTCFKKQQNNRAKICIISYSWLFTVGSSEHFMQPFPHYVFYFWKPVLLLRSESSPSVPSAAYTITINQVPVVFTWGSVLRAQSRSSRSVCCVNHTVIRRSYCPTVHHYC